LQVDPKIMAAKFKKMSDDLDLPSCELKKIYNSNLAQQLGCWAEAMNKGDDYHAAVFNAFYGNGLNISDPGVLADIAQSIGLSGNDAIKHIENKTFKPHVDSDWQLARKLNLLAAPTYIVNQKKLVGAHPYKRLQNFLEANGAGKRL